MGKEGGGGVVSLLTASRGREELSPPICNGEKRAGSPVDVKTS